MSKDRLVEAAIEAVAAIFNDTSVSPTETRERLMLVLDEIDIRQDALENEEATQ